MLTCKAIITQPRFRNVYSLYSNMGASITYSPGYFRREKKKTREKDTIFGLMELF